MSDLSLNKAQWQPATPSSQIRQKSGAAKTDNSAATTPPVASKWQAATASHSARSNALSLGNTQARLAQSIQMASPQQVNQQSQQLSALTLDIQSTISRLKPTQTVERTGLAQAQAEFRQDSLSDRQALQQTAEATQTQAIVAPQEVNAQERQQFFQQLGAENNLGRKLAVIETSLTGKIAELQNIAGQIEKVQTGKGKDLPGLDALNLQRLNTAQQIKNLKQTRADLSQQAQDSFKAQLTEPMTHSLSLLSRQELSSELESAVGKGLLADTLLDSISQGLPNRILGNDSVMIGGEKYINRTKLAEGGMGAVYAYEHAQTGQKIVVKQPLNEEAQHEVVAELKAHRHAMGADGTSGDPRLVKLLGAVASDQGPLIALEYVDGGDVYGCTQKTLPRALESGMISAKSAELLKLHLFYGMLDSTAHLKNDRGMTHFDIKADNFFMSADGTVKIGDFGLTRAETNTQWVSEDARDNPTYLAPELMIERREAQEKDVSHKSDNWSLGTAAHIMFMNEQIAPAQGKFMSRVEKQVKAFGDNPNNRILDPSAGQMQIGKRDNLGPTGMNKLLNRLMDPSPENRVSLEAAMQSSVFKDLFESDGSTIRPEIKQLFQALNQKPQDQQLIQQLSSQVDN